VQLLVTRAHNCEPITKQIRKVMVAADGIHVELMQ